MTRCSVGFFLASLLPLAFCLSRSGCLSTSLFGLDADLCRALLSNFVKGIISLILHSERKSLGRCRAGKGPWVVRTPGPRVLILTFSRFLRPIPESSLGHLLLAAGWKPAMHTVILFPTRASYSQPVSKTEQHTIPCSGI